MPSPQSIKPSAGNSARAEGPRALCVDDNPTSLRLLYEVTRKAGFTVETARDGVEALAAYTASAPVDVVVTDHEMPLMNGLQLTRALREAHFGGRIVVVSSHVPPPVAQQYRALGVVEILQKPFAVRELMAALADR